MCRRQMLMLLSPSEKEPDELLLLMSSSILMRSYPPSAKPLCDPENNNKHTETPDKSQKKMNGEFRIGTSPYEKCIAVSTKLNLPSSVTERNANIYMPGAKYSECSYTEPLKQSIKGNAEKTVCGVVI